MHAQKKQMMQAVRESESSQWVIYRADLYRVDLWPKDNNKKKLY